MRGEGFDGSYSFLEASVMRCTRSLSGKFQSVLWPGLFALALVAQHDHAGLLFSTARAEQPKPQSAPPKADEKAKAQNVADLRELQRIFGDNPVTILANSGPVEGVRIIDVVTVFGKQYLQLQKKDGKALLIRADLITGIRDD
jgi:hypothetical protein